MSQHTEIVQRLIDQIHKEKDWKSAFEDAVDKCMKQAPDELKKYDIKDLNSYYDFMDHLANWIPTENRDSTKILEELRVFYFLFSQPSVKKYQTPIKPKEAGEQDATWLTKWITEFASEMGKWMDTPDSISDDSIKSFYETPKYHMDDYPVPPGGWKTFNDFLARHIDPSVRPIEQPDQDELITSPVDATFKGHYKINSDNMIEVKGVKWNVADLVKAKDHASVFKDGTLLHFSLAPWDYHRVHVPVSGRMVMTDIIQAEAILDAVAEHGKVEKNPDTQLGYQWLQTRGLFVVENSMLGLVAILPVGMGQVSSVSPIVQNGQNVQKGDGMAYFQYGGSDVLVVFQDKAKVDVMAEKDKHYNMGEAIGKAGQH